MLISNQIKTFNAEFNSLHLNYLFTEGNTISDVIKPMVRNYIFTLIRR